MKGLILLAVIGLLFGLTPAHANYWEGHEAFRRGDYATAYREYLRLAELGHAAAQFNLGYLYHHGLAVPRNPTEAAKWYRASAEQGRVEAQFSLGTLYETGTGVPRDQALAYRWYNLAASNVPPGVSRDRLIRHRDRIANQLSAAERDAVEAVPAPDGFTLGADLAAAQDQPAGPAPAVADIQRELAERSFNPGAIDGEMGRSTVGALSAFQASNGLAVTGEADPPTLAKLFGPEEVAPHLEPFPRAVAVPMDPTPPAVPVPPVEAVPLDSEPAPAMVAEAAAEEPAAAEPPVERAEPPAAPEAARSPGEAARQDPEEDLPSEDPAALRRLAEQGDASAQINLATLYHYGQGVAEDHAEAVKWYRMAAKQGRVDALFPLGSIYESGAGDLRDLVEAYRWYSLAAAMVPEGKAHDIIVERRDRVARELSPDLLVSPPDSTVPVDEADGLALAMQPVQPATPNRPPTDLVVTSPDGTTLDRAMVAENAAAGTVVGILSAWDPDPGDVLSYALSEDAGGRFAIDAETGTLEVGDGAPLDFEASPSQEIVVRVTDAGGLSYDQTLAVGLIDINEAPQAKAIAFAVAENAAAGTVLGRIAASDPDGGANGRLSFALDGAGPFAVDPTTGDVTVAEAASLDFETAPRFELTAIATDGGGLSARIPVTVTLEDANESPGGIEMASGGTVAEHAPANTLVGRVSASDPDAGDRLTYSLVEDAGGRFAIDPESGTIRVAEGADLQFGAVTDRFTINPDNGLIVPSNGGRLDLATALAHKVVVRVTDSGGLSRDAALAIQVADVNDRPWAEAGAFTVAENSPGGTLVGRIRAKDPDGGVNGTLSYAITAGDGDGRFAIDAKTGRITVADGAALDFEADPAFELTATVTDGGGLSTAVPVTVALRDVNEPPEDLGMTGGTVAERAANGTVVARLLASDPDAGDHWTYSLTDDAGGRFAIDAETGTIAVADGARLDFDEADRHDIGVRVTDSGGLSYMETLTVMVGNENFAPTGVTLSNAEVAENAPGGTLVAEISARDPDAGEHLTFELIDDAGGRFAIDPETGRITVSAGARLDYEEETRYQLTVRVVDSGGLAFESALAVAVGDVNEAPRAAPASFVLDEVAAAGTTVGRLQASDPDRGVNGRLRYALARDDSGGRFALDPASGIITVAEGADLDFEGSQNFELQVTVTDGGGLSDSAPVTIALLDRNEPPSDMRLVGVQVPENAVRGRLAGQVVAFDPDAGDHLSYGLTDDAGGRFEIDAETGTIRVADPARLDFEAAASHRLAVRVTDSGGLTYDGVVTIALSDANEAPTVRGDRLVVAEHSAAGTVVGRLDASDPDAGDRLSYTLSDGAAGRFTIDGKTGAIFVTDGADLDFETAPGYEVTAKVTDSGGLGDTVVVAIALADVNEAPSASVAIEGMVAENAKPGTLAAAVAATDPDAGDRLTYSLLSDAGGRFAIDARTGLITVADGARLDFEQTPEHEVRVRVTDSSGLSDEQSLVIALLDVDQPPATKDDLLAMQGAGTNGFAIVADGATAGTPDGMLDGKLDGMADGKLDGMADGKLDGKLDGNGLNASRTVNLVAAIQAQLVEAGFDPGPVDGKMGPLTRAALSDYQQAFGLADLQDKDLFDHLLVRAHFRRGYEHQVQGEYDESIEEYAEVLRLDPDHFSAHFNRGLIHYAETRYDLAIEDFDKIIDLRPDYAGAFVNRGNALYQQGRYGEAARDYLKAVELWFTSLL